MRQADPRCRVCGKEDVKFYSNGGKSPYRVCTDCHKLKGIHGYQRELFERYQAQDDNVSICLCGRYYTIIKHDRFMRPVGEPRNKCTICIKK